MREGKFPGKVVKPDDREDENEFPDDGKFIDFSLLLVSFTLVIHISSTDCFMVVVCHELDFTNSLTSLTMVR